MAGDGAATNADRTASATTKVRRCAWTTLAAQKGCTGLTPGCEHRTCPAWRRPGNNRHILILLSPADAECCVAATQHSTSQTTSFGDEPYRRLPCRSPTLVQNIRLLSVEDSPEKASLEVAACRWASDRTFTDRNLTVNARLRAASGRPLGTRRCLRSSPYRGPQRFRTERSIQESNPLGSIGDICGRKL
jgi:hypothetical protein